MKNLSRLCFALLLLVGFNANAQDENNPWGLGIGINAVDVYPTGGSAPLGKNLDEFFNAEDHYNILPSLSTISVSRYLSDGFSANVTGSLNRIDKWGDAPADDLSYYALDGMVKYSISELIDLGNFDPYVGLGGGYTWIDEVGAGTLNATGGLTYWFTDNVGATVQSSYKHAFEDYLQEHFQHSVGVAFKFGGKDTDGDGIYDQDDACPDVAGLAEFNGCPDADGDGIEDAKDECPNEAGLAEFNGCPDTDGDGVADKDDKCPTVAGLKELAGCPDADGDGVADSDDKCPNEVGPAANNGCPWPDRDGDSVIDKDDECPDTPGTVANKGCPELTEAVKKALNEYAKTILFETGKSTIKAQSEKVLADITAILKEYPNARFNVDGHTDSVGSKATNQKLSEARAAAVKTHLEANGIEASRLESHGYGESKPIDSNKTRAGRRNNRRVEINLIKN